ncbi:unnamed protein product [Acanthoscelides obtectus]|uniref:Uncharacterized protein n=1 Tax=Acanthoscelides obtectus TaxID=200917 RepID=A0A9P0KLZ2_ACAOB|nr:unnamed protein product [Acanthoscelides obtectus]CAK1647316.1 hypothetical protein AOBTE_LOCUS15176 [Acanthoscelides obtectus]
MACTDQESEIINGPKMANPALFTKRSMGPTFARPVLVLFQLDKSSAIVSIEGTSFFKDTKNCDIVCEFLHILESCTDPGLLTSTLVNISLASQVACTFKVGFPFRLIYSSPWRFGFRIPICVQSITPIAVGNLYMLCHIRFGLHQFMVGSWKLDPFIRLCNYAVHNSIHSPRYRCLNKIKFLTNTLLISRVTEKA